MRLLLALLVAIPSYASAVRLERPNLETRPNVIVDTVPGLDVGCIIVDQRNLRELVGFRKLHAVACVTREAGEVLILILRKNGTVYCTGNGYLDAPGASCADVNLCGRPERFCLF